MSSLRTQERGKAIDSISTVLKDEFEIGDVDVVSGMGRSEIDSDECQNSNSIVLSKLRVVDGDDSRL